MLALLIAASLFVVVALAKAVDPVTARNLKRLAVAGVVLLVLLFILGVVASTR